MGILQQYVADNEADLDVRRYRKQLPLYSRREFVVKRFDQRLHRNVLGAFWRAAYKAQALVVGFNLPFDLSRLAIEVADARQSYGGGFSFALWDYQDKQDGIWRADSNRPRLLIRSLNSKQHLFRFTDRRVGDPEDYETWESEDGEQHRTAFSGHFLDLRTLAFALSDKSYSLDKACDDFAVEHGKQEFHEHGKITPEYIDYNRRDVKATGELLIKLLEEFGRHPISLQVTKAFSPASLAKSYQKAMAIDAVLARQDFPSRQARLCHERLLWRPRRMSHSSPGVAGRLYRFRLDVSHGERLARQLGDAHRRGNQHGRSKTRGERFSRHGEP